MLSERVLSDQDSKRLLLRFDMRWVFRDKGHQGLTEWIYMKRISTVDQETLSMIDEELARLVGDKLSK